jgi:hypothetical protein
MKRTVEIYIGYTDRTWDTDYIEVPELLIKQYSEHIDIIDDLTKIYDKHLNEIEPQVKEGMPDIAFIGVYSFPVEEGDE